MLATSRRPFAAASSRNENAGKGRHPPEGGLSNGAGIWGGFIMTSRDNERASFGLGACLGEIYREGKSLSLNFQKLNQTSSRPKKLLLTLSKSTPQRAPARPLALGRRGGALSSGGTLSDGVSGVVESGSIHWTKMPCFRRFSASLHRIQWPGFTICSLAADTSSSAPPDS